jgi:hypothetical protein
MTLNPTFGILSAFGEEAVVGRKHKSRDRLHPSSSSDEASFSHPASPRSFHDSAEEGASHDSHLGSWHGSSTDDGDEVGPKRSKLSKAKWTADEDLFILANLRMIGTQWPQIARQMQGRTADGVRNRWHRLQHTYGLANIDRDEGKASLDELLTVKGWSPAQGLPPPPFRPGAAAGSVAAAAGSGASGTMLPLILEADPARKTGVAHGRSVWSAEEDELIEEGVRRFGCKWCARRGPLS